MEDGYEWVVDIDLEKFFDRVNHQRLMARLALRVKDKRLLVLIGRMLKAKVVMPDGLVEGAEEGVPQGGPLSPLLSNIVLDELDWELAARGHRFVRYADDANIYVRSERAGQRVMESVEILLSARSKERIKERIRELTPRNWGCSISTCIRKINEYNNGWIGFFGICTEAERRTFSGSDAHIRRRLRAIQLKQWKRKKTIAKRLISFGVRDKTAWRCVYDRERS